MHMADEQKEKGKGSSEGKRGGGPPALQVHDFVLGDMGPVGKGAFEAPVSLRLLVKGEPPYQSVRYQFDVGGIPQPVGFRELNTDGVVSEKLRFERAGQPLRLRTQWYGSRP